MIDQTKTYKTRDGREVRIYATDGEGDQTIHGAVNDGGEWLIYAWHGDGVYARSDRNGRHDLIEVKPRHKRTVWLNVMKDASVTAFTSKETADLCAPTRAYISKTVGDTDYIEKEYLRLACVKVEIDVEEGEGL